MKTVAIFGATSAIAVETARLFAGEGAKLFLVARNKERLEAVEQDLGVRGAAATRCSIADLSDTSTHEALLREVAEFESGADVVLIAYGSLPNQEEAQKNFSVTESEIQTNFLSVVSLLTGLSEYFENKGAGVIAVISSVAGDRGRQSNYIYGAAKGGLSIFLQGLRNRLFSKGVHVLDIKPGFVDTPMTSGIKRGPLFVSPEVIAKGIVRAIEKKKNVVYLPFFWLGIMCVIKHIPEAVFKRLKL